MPLIWLLTLFFLISVLLLGALKHTKRRGRQPPCPRGLPIIGNLHQLGELPHQSLCRLSSKYGPVMLLKLGTVSTVVVSSPETAKQVLKDHDLNCCSRPSVEGTRKLSYNYLDIAFSRFDDYWKELRKLCVEELFSTKRTNSIQPIKQMEMKKLVYSITESALEKTPVNLSEKFLSWNVNVVCKASFGVSFQGTVLDNGRLQDLIHEALEMMGSFSAADFYPYIGWIVDWFSGLHARRERSVRDLDAFYEQMIDLHLRKDRAERSEDDFVDLLLRLEKEEAVLGYGKLTRNHIKAILMDILLGGINTSSITMTWAMAELARNQRVMKKVQSEIRDQIGENNKARIIALDEIEQLNYLKMVIKETFRLHPAAPLLVPREVLSEFQINGYTIQPKTRLHVNVWAIGRDPKIWKDPEEFIPERFMDCDIDVKGQHFELLPFGSGRRICPALYMGTTTVEFGLANLLYQFDWQLPEGLAVEDIDMDEGAGLTAHKKHDLQLVPVKALVL